MNKQTKMCFLGVILMVSSIAFASQETKATEDPEAAYTRVIKQRAEKIVVTLGIADSAKAERVRDIIADQYRSLRDIHDSRDAQIKVVKSQAGDKQEAVKITAKALEDMAQTLQDLLHTQYLVKLSVELNPEQIEKVKDGMTYGTRLVTYNQYMALFPDIDEEHKAKIMSFLVEAREKAMDGGSSDEKHQWFRKYKGKINNYLSTAGYDMKKAEEDLKRRQQAAASEKQ